ncbi:MAG: hypothetical protein K2X44_03900 [Magnetospirillum sp.]|nr:hypothetical protein [Magnetospirillum sp.]
MLRPMLVVAALLLPAVAMAQTAPGWTKTGPAPQQAPAAPAAAANGNSGKVLETQNAGGYTYLRVDSAGREMWIAIPESAIATGATVQWAPGATMQNFHSKSLNKTFPQILFSGGAQVVK